jgi:hypothetical protein
MLTEIALQSCIAQSSQLTQMGDNFTYKTKNSVERGEDVNIILSGQYEIVANKDVIEMMEWKEMDMFMLPGPLITSKKWETKNSI